MIRLITNRVICKVMAPEPWILMFVVILVGVIVGVFWFFNSHWMIERPFIKQPAETRESESNFCDNCGKSLRPTAKFCSGCGSPRS